MRRTEVGSRLLDDRRYRVVTKAVFSLVFNLIFVFYNGILGVLSASLIFAASAVYYLALSVMRFSALVLERRDKEESDRRACAIIGVMLIVLSVIFHVMVIMSMRYKTATLYGTITMIAIATFTFGKITAAIVSAVRHKDDISPLIGAVNMIRYSEVAVSLLTMQQSMLVSFGEGNDRSSVILNVCTGAAVCFFILALGIITLRNSRKEDL